MKKPLSDPPLCTENLLAMNDTLDILGGKWKLLVLHYLIIREGDTNTFKKMERDIEGISAKMLSKELKDLEVNKMVYREVQNTKPVTVAYSITDYGKTTKEIIDVLVDWGKNHRMKMINEF
ncbi:helix-turn-helix transcriptional regulator [Empedobacter falsenii]|jgi:DNA-binding HxlR family transcriptional regulator|uniref:Helix-turn-helix transcriptional regulator n=1 Tax=Empedobacter falsenii TaxID=343874 RepID=A0AAW7DHP3_9FLAO|nr:helix-turn-helix domain-containing protein [Empedobacter falsenii]MDM1063837.1 helix-turn-helix transcriptional regulator [Empedobacter falsenii]MDM1548504.1 helix-turn-helix transcriptional regulator [Empedobacter falsenii]MDM1551501.1 helix-turn-helix transcriptional regulator [Empedobacter falsenii]